MEETMTKLLRGFVVFGAFLLFLPSVGLGQITVTVNCPGESLQATINNPVIDNVTISVNGTCNENITIGGDKTYLTLDGGGAATINALIATQPTVVILSRYAVIKGFNITGGIDGIQVVRGATANIDGNDIQSSGRMGIAIVQNSYGRIINNSIHNNSFGGIVVTDNSFADIGVNGPFDAAAQPNNIYGNGNGINLGRTSSARIVGNTISNNMANGVLVEKVSFASISGNIINGNSQNGILVTQNSGVNLGNDTGSTIYDLPNSTTVNNGDKGLRCTIGGYADGRLGTLNGAGPNPTNFSNNCINSLVPLTVGVLGVPYGMGWGGPAFTPVPGDFDGDGKTDVAIHDPGTGVWWIIPSSGAPPYGIGWGGPGFTPVLGDFDGDGKTDIAIYQATTGAWYIIPSSP